MVCVLSLFLANQAFGQDVEFDDNLTRELLLRAIGHTKDLKELSKDWSELEKYRDPSDLKRALDMLRSCRQNHDSLDLQLAAADHYALMRWRTADYGVESLKQFPQKYYDLKKATLASGAGNNLQVTDRPVSKLSLDVLRYGKRGSVVGLNEYEKRTKKQRRSSAIFQFATDAYFDWYFKSVKRLKGPKPKVDDICTLEYAINIGKSRRKNKPILLNQK